MVLRRRSSARMYELGRRIAVGGMGEVYDGLAPDLKRRIAVKRVLKGHDSTDLKELFFREVAVAAALEHPNVVEVLDAGIVGSDLYLVMELVEGNSLAEVAGALALAGRRLPTEVVCGIVAQIARGLAHAHERAMPDGTPLGIIHRDVAPENILISRQGLPKLVDFGLATLAGHDFTDPGTIRGRPRFLSPEQARGEHLDARSDIFSLGALTFELLAGAPLYTEENLVTLLWKVTEGKFAPIRERLPEADPDLVRILESALAPDPRDRFRSARELERALDGFRAARGMRVDSTAISAILGQVAPVIAQLRAEKEDEGPGELEGTTLVLCADRLDTTGLGHEADAGGVSECPKPSERANAKTRSTSRPASPPPHLREPELPSRRTPALEGIEPRRVETPRAAVWAVEPQRLETPRVEAWRLEPRRVETPRSGSDYGPRLRPPKVPRLATWRTPTADLEPERPMRVPTPSARPINEKLLATQRSRERSWFLFVGLILAAALTTFVIAWGKDPPKTPKDAVTETVPEHTQGSLVIPSEE